MFPQTLDAVMLAYRSHIMHTSPNRYRVNLTEKDVPGVARRMADLEIFHSPKTKEPITREQCEEIVSKFVGARFWYSR